MAHFYGTVQGGRGEASRLGTKKDGIHSSARGWKLGVDVQGNHTTVDDTAFDQFTVDITGGSGNSRSLASFTVRRQHKNPLLIEVQPDGPFVASIPPQFIGALLSRIDDKAMIQWVSDMIISNPAWANYLRTKLWLEDKHVAT